MKSKGCWFCRGRKEEGRIRYKKSEKLVVLEGQREGGNKQREEIKGWGCSDRRGEGKTGESRSAF